MAKAKKFNLKQKRRLLKFIKIGQIVLCVALIGAVCFLGVALRYIGGFTIVIDADSVENDYIGFGASSAWIFQKLGLRDETTKTEAINMLYGADGLALNIFRYNIGAGSSDSALDDLFPYNQASFDQARRGESFFIADNFKNAESFSNENNYDFTRDAGVRDLLKRSVEIGNIKRVVFFANSPHYLMTESGMATGEDEYQNNLKPDYYAAFSDYLLIITNALYQTYLLDKNIEILISPVNEPQWRWGGENATQEGCHFDPEELAAFYDVFYTRLTAFNSEKNVNFKLEIFENGNISLLNPVAKVRSYLKNFAKYDFFDEIESISTHSYGNNTIVTRSSFEDLISGKYNKNVSVTEFCEMYAGRDNSIDSAIHTAQVMLRDLKYLNATDWSWWLAVSDGDYNDGLVYWDVLDETDKLSVLNRYYAFGQFSRYITTGDKHISSRASGLTIFSNVEFVSFLKPDGTIIIVLTNDSNYKKTIGFKDQTIIGGSYTNSELSWAKINVSNENYIVLEPKSITTLELK
ncbi:MAG: hypothetical protein LBE09_09305 [Christensenellaceae bacterium]|jgi:O-glycosyl hydrolase|nr:hypothetical protein [Christensenellaceae bacterium]